MLLHRSLSFQTTWKALIAAPTSNVICVYLMLPCLASFWKISKISTKVRYSVITMCIGGKYDIFVGATSFLAYIDARNPTNLGTPWEVSALRINFYKVNNKRSRVSWSLFSVFVLFTVSNRVGLTLGLKEWIFTGFDSRRRKDWRLFFSILIVNSSVLEPSTISWKAIPGVVFILPPPLSRSILRSKLSHQKTVRTLK